MAYIEGHRKDKYIQDHLDHPHKVLERKQSKDKREVDLILGGAVLVICGVLAFFAWLVNFYAG